MPPMRPESGCVYSRSYATVRYNSSKYCCREAILRRNNTNTTLKRNVTIFFTVRLIALNKNIVIINIVFSPSVSRPHWGEGGATVCGPSTTLHTRRATARRVLAAHHSLHSCLSLSRTTPPWRVT